MHVYLVLLTLLLPLETLPVGDGSCNSSSDSVVIEDAGEMSAEDSG